MDQKENPQTENENSGIIELISTLTPPVTLEKVQELLEKITSTATSREVSEFLQEVIQPYLDFEPEAIKKKYQVIELSLQLAKEDNTPVEIVIPEFAYLSPEQFQEVIKWKLDVSGLCKSIIIGGMAERHPILPDQLEYLKKNIAAFAKKEYFGLLETYFEGLQLRDKAITQYNNMSAIAEILILNPGFDLIDNLVLSPDNILLEKPEYTKFGFNAQKLDIYKTGLQNLSEEYPDKNIYNEYFKKLFKFLEKYPPQAILFTDYPQDVYSLEGNLVIAGHKEGNDLEYKLFSLHNFVHEINHYILEKIFNNYANPYNVEDNAAKERFHTKAKDVFVNVLQLLKEKAINELGSVDIQPLLDKDNYFDIINSIKEDTEYKKLFSIFLLLHWTSILTCFDTDIKHIRKDTLEAFKALGYLNINNPEPDNETIRDICIKKTESILKKFEVADREALTVIASIFDPYLYNDESYDAELIVRFHESMVVNGMISSIMESLKEYWDCNIEEALSASLAEVDLIEAKSLFDD